VDTFARNYPTVALDSVHGFVNTVNPGTTLR